MNIDERVRTLRDPELDVVSSVEHDRIVQRLLAEQAARTAARATSPAGSPRARRVLILVACLAVLGAGTAIAADTNPIEWAKRTWFPHQASESIGSTKDASLPPLTDAEMRTVRTMLDGMPVDQGDLGPLLSEMQPMRDGRVLFDGATGRVAALASQRGDVCIVWSGPGAARPSGGTCIGELPLSGVAFVSGHDGDIAELPALFADDVTAVSIETRDGTVHEVELGTNGFLWRSTGSAGDEPALMRVLRAGERYEINLDDPRRASRQ